MWNIEISLILWDSAYFGEYKGICGVLGCSQGVFCGFVEFRGISGVLGVSGIAGFSGICIFWRI